MIESVSAAMRDPARPRLREYGELPLRPWFLAPPPRIASDFSAAMLTMHTIQSPEAYETLVRDGVLVGDASLGWAEFREAYAWMLRQMDRRLPGPSDGLLWLWPTATRTQLRQDARRARGDVLLSVRVVRERALLSEFMDWHAVLNRCLHIPVTTGESEDDWESRWCILDDDFRARVRPYEKMPIIDWPDDLRAEIESSWEAIFDPVTWRAKPTLQATVRELRAADVVRAVRIR